MSCVPESRPRNGRKIGFRGDLFPKRNSPAFLADLTPPQAASKRLQAPIHLCSYLPLVAPRRFVATGHLPSGRRGRKDPGRIVRAAFGRHVPVHLAHHDDPRAHGSLCSVVDGLARPKADLQGRQAVASVVPHRQSGPAHPRFPSDCCTFRY